MNHPKILCAFGCAVLLLTSAGTAAAQTPRPSPAPLKLSEAVNYALTNYPAVRAAIERITAAQGGVSLARTNYLPRADMLWQANRGTRNNIFGQLLPQSIVPGMSGPVLATTSDESAWGSAAGLLVSWEPFDFGLRRANVETSEAALKVSRAEADVTRLDVATACAGAFLDVIASQQAVRAAEANVARRQALTTSVHALVDNELRPGADASRADAELALARSQLIQAQTAERMRRAVLADLLGKPATPLNLDPGALFDLPPVETLPPAAVSANPGAAAQQSLVEELQANERSLERSYFPKFLTQASVSGRGSGANTDGTFGDGSAGLGLMRANWAVGLTVTFPAFDIFAIRDRKAIAAANERAATSDYNRVIDDLTAQMEQDRATLDGAHQIAQNTPIELSAARSGETQASARYQSGLATIVEVTEAQSLLLQAEVDDAVAKLNVWRALASMAATQGTLDPFLRLLDTDASGRK